MTTNYPGDIDSYTRALASDAMNAPSHAGQHDNAFDAVEAIEAKVGKGASTPTANTFLIGDGVGSSSWGNTVPTGDVVGTSDTQVLTNKTLTAPTINAGTINAPTLTAPIATLTTVSYGATSTINLTSGYGPVYSLTLTGNTILAISGAATGKVFVLRLLQDAAGSHTVTWWATIKWSGGTAPTLTTTGSTLDAFGFICTSAGNYDGYIIGQNLS